MKKKTLIIGAIATTALVVGGLALAQSIGPGPRHFGPQFMEDEGPDAMGPGAMRQHMGQRMGPGMMQKGPGMMHQKGPGMMQRMGPGMGPGMTGMHPGSATTAEHSDIRELFFNHDAIKRTVSNLPNGIRTVTESDDPQVAEVIKKHVVDMGRRIEEGRDPGLPIESPALHSLFRDKDKIKSTYEVTEKGIIVVQTSTDTNVVKALQDHAAEVSDLARRGMIAGHEAMLKNGGGMMHGPMMRGPTVQ